METLDYCTTTRFPTSRNRALRVYQHSRRAIAGFHFPGDEQHAGQRASRRAGKRPRRAERIPRVAACEAAGRAPDTERETAVDCLAARLVAAAKNLVNDADRRGVEGAEACRMQRLRYQERGQAAGAPADQQKP